MHQRNHGTGRSGSANRGARQQRGVREQGWPSTFMVLGFLFGLFCAGWVLPRTHVPPLVVVRTLVLCCAVGLVLPYVVSGLRLGMAKGEWVFFNLMGIGPTAFGALLLLNHLVHAEPMCTVASVSVRPELTVTTVSGEYPWRPDIGRMVHISDRTEATTHYRICVAKGALGYWAIVDATALPVADAWEHGR